MSTIDEIMSEVMDLGGMCIIGRDQLDLVAQADVVRALIAAALADARRDGAEQMREAAADAGYAAAFGGTDVRDVYRAIRAMPLPTGPRQAVRLTDEQIGRAYCAALHEDYVEPASTGSDQAAHAALMCVGRAIESAVLAANGLEGGAA